MCHPEFAPGAFDADKLRENERYTLKNDSAEFSAKLAGFKELFEIEMGTKERGRGKIFLQFEEKLLLQVF